MLLVASSMSAAIPAAQHDALVALYNSTNGPAWTNRTNWLGGAGTECTWFGVRCDEGATTVHTISLPNNNLSGSLPPQIGAFPDLRELTLFTNAIGGAIPPQIGSLTKLDRLELYENRFSGSIPRELGQLTSVTFFALGNNQLTGSIPPELGNLASVTFFSINGGLLTGPIPPELGRLGEVETLSLSFNQIGGSIPKELGQLPRLVELQLNDNQLTGSIPPELGQISTLRSLFLQINRLTGPLPSELGSLTNLEALSVGANNLNGPLPKELGNLGNLQSLSLDRNGFTGPLPVELTQLRNLMSLDAGSNALDGELPPQLGDLSKLQYLVLSQNRFSGSIPSPLGRLTDLRTLALGSNQLTGSIPRELAQLTKLIAFEAAGNRLTGPIPPELGQLRDLETFVVFENQLSGTIPSSFGDLTKMRLLLLGGNALSGTIPPELMRMTELTFLDLRGNRLTGPIPPAIENLTKLENLSVFGNSLTGTLPAGIGKLTNLTILRVDDNDLSGPIPADLGQLSHLDQLLLTNNHFEGTVPATLFNLTSLTSFSVGGNRLTGAIAADVGRLTQLRTINLANNQFRGDAPASLLNLTNLIDNLSDFRFNAITTSNTALRDFLNRKQDGADWLGTQTLPPSAISVSDVTDRSAIVHWTRIPYSSDEGGYRITFTGGGSSVVTTTSSKEIDSAIVRGLRASTAYTIEVRAVTHPHGLQQNTIISDPAPAASTTTGATVILPPLVEMTTAPSGLVQTGATATTDSFVLSNSGDVATTITLTQQGAFFTQAPITFTLGGGQSQTVTLTAIPQPPGSYDGLSIPSGTGVPSAFTIPVRLLSTTPPAGTAIASTSRSRVDANGDANSSSTVTVTFTNNGTAALSGIAVSDEPWLIAPTVLITIEPGASRDVTFTIDRRKKPAASGALTANLKLIYVSGLVGPSDTTSPNVSITIVSVVDTTKPAVAPGTIPPLTTGEVARFIPGVANLVRAGGSYISDVSLTNSFGIGSLTDLRMYFGSATPSVSVATIAPVATNQSVQLASVVSSVFAGEGSGTIQLRTRDWDKLLVHANLLNVAGSRGTAGTAIPIFRSDRAAAPGEQLVLTGVRKSATMSGDLYVQETTGSLASASIEFIDAAGARVGAPLDGIAVDGFRLRELTDAVPAGAVTAIVKNDNGSSGRIVAYATIRDQSSGDSWAVVDWRRFFGLSSGDDLRIPFVRSESAAGAGRRRAVRHAAGDDAPARTDVTIFNGGSDTAIGTLRYFESSGSTFDQPLTIEPRQTLELTDIIATRFGRRGSSGYLVISPSRGNMTVTGRTSSSAGLGTGLPALAASSGLRLGQLQQFANLEAATPSVIAARSPGTLRASFGIAEVAGERIKVLATILFSDGRSVVSTYASNVYDVPAYGSLFIDDGMTSILGVSRERFGTLHNVQLQFQVMEGNGAASVFVLSIDNGSGDSILRLE